MGVTHTYANENEEQPKNFFMRIFQLIILLTDYKTVEKILLCVICCLQWFVQNANPWQHIAKYFGNYEYNLWIMRYIIAYYGHLKLYI